MMMSEDQPMLPHARFCEAYPLSLWCLRRGAPGANRERRYLCSIRRDLFAGGTRRGGRRLRLPRNFHSSALGQSGSSAAAAVSSPSSAELR